MWEMAAVVIVIVLIGFFVFVSRKSAMNRSQQFIAPAQYQADFVQAGRSHLLLDVRTPGRATLRYTSCRSGWLKCQKSSLW